MCADRSIAFCRFIRVVRVLMRQDLLICGVSLSLIVRRGKIPVIVRLHWCRILDMTLCHVPYIRGIGAGQLGYMALCLWLWRSGWKHRQGPFRRWKRRW